MSSKTTYRILNTTTEVPSRESTAVITRKGEFYQVHPTNKYFPSREAWISEWQGHFDKANKQYGEGTFAMEVREYVTPKGEMDKFTVDILNKKVTWQATELHPSRMGTRAAPKPVEQPAPIQASKPVVNIPVQAPKSVVQEQKAVSKQKDPLEDALMNLSKDDLLRLVLYLRNDGKVSSAIQQLRQTTTTTTTTTTKNTNTVVNTPVKQTSKPATPTAPKKEVKPYPLSKLKWDYKKHNKATLPPGRYYIGDLCYALQSDLYDNVYGPEYKDGLYTSTAGSFLMLGTGGDGEFKSNHNYAYPVDAGHIGIASIELCNPEKDVYGGQLFTFKEPVECHFTDEAFRFYSGSQYLRISNYGDYDEDEDEDEDDNESDC